MTAELWVRFLKPGTYRLHVVSHRVSRITHPERANPSLLYPAGEMTPVVVDSDAITLEIHAAPDEWVREQISAATSFIDGPHSQLPSDSDARRKAILTLRFLNTPKSALELARRMDNGTGVTYWDLIDTSYRPHVLDVLEKRLVGAAESIDIDFLAGLAELAENVASGGTMPPCPDKESEKKAWQGESERRTKVRQDKFNLYTRRLISALPDKQPNARAHCLVGLLNASNRTVPRPDWMGMLSTTVVADFQQLPAGTQEVLLASHWPAVKARQILPVLQDIFSSQSASESLRDLALRRIYDLDPDEGRRLIIEEIRRRQRHIPFSTLAMLPNKSLPELDDVLAASYDNNAMDADRLILRYATGVVAGRVRKEYEQREERRASTMVGPVVYYLFKYDPRFAEQELRRSLTTSGGPPAQYDIGFQFLAYGPWAMSPALEHLAIELLSSSSVPVKKGAAEILGKYGSPNAKKPLCHTLEFFHSWWKGREEELSQPPFREGPEFERTLVSALAQADSWVLTEQEFAELEQLCISRMCREQVRKTLAETKAPVHIAVQPSALFPITIGPFTIASEEQLHRKLSQYPAGSTFRFDHYGGGYEPPAEVKQARQYIEKAIRDGGHTVVE